MLHSSMPYVKNHSYRGIPFSIETPLEDFIMYDVVSKLYDTCESNKEEIIKIRTVGLLKSKHGSFFIKEMTATHAFVPADPKQCIHVSLAYMHSPISTLGLPYPVQIIGKLQWKGHPVVFAQIIQALNVSVAAMIHDTMLKVSTTHTCEHAIDLDEHDNNTGKNL